MSSTPGVTVIFIQHSEQSSQPTSLNNQFLVQNLLAVMASPLVTHIVLCSLIGLPPIQTETTHNRILQQIIKTYGTEDTQRRMLQTKTKPPSIGYGKSNVIEGVSEATQLQKFSIVTHLDYETQIETSSFIEFDSKTHLTPQSLACINERMYTDQYSSGTFIPKTGWIKKNLFLNWIVVYLMFFDWFRSFWCYDGFNHLKWVIRAKRMNEIKRRKYTWSQSPLAESIRPLPGATLRHYKLSTWELFKFRFEHTPMSIWTWIFVLPLFVSMFSLNLVIYYISSYLHWLAYAHYIVMFPYVWVFLRRYFCVVLTHIDLCTLCDQKRQMKAKQRHKITGSNLKNKPRERMNLLVWPYVLFYPIFTLVFSIFIILYSLYRQIATDADSRSSVGICESRDIGYDGDVETFDEQKRKKAKKIMASDPSDQ